MAGRLNLKPLSGKTKGFLRVPREKALNRSKVIMAYLIDQIKQSVTLKDYLSTLGCHFAGLDGKCASPLQGSSTPGKEDKAFSVFAGGTMFKCHRSGHTGDVIKLRSIIDGVSYRDAAMLFAREHNLVAQSPSGDAIDWEDFDREQAELASVVEINGRIRDAFHGLLEPSHRLWLGRRYGFTDEIIDAFRVGFCPDKQWDETLGATFAEASRVGLARMMSRASDDPDEPGKVSKWNVMRGRIVFWYLDRAGRPVYAIGRKLDSDDPKSPKYFKALIQGGNNSYVSPQVKNILWGEDTLRTGAKNKPVVVAEGITDSIILAHLGYRIVSPITKQIRKKDVEEILGLLHKNDKIVIIPDEEESGEGLRGAMATVTDFAHHGRCVYLAALSRPQGAAKADVASVYTTQGEGPIHEAVAASVPFYRRVTTAENATDMVALVARCDTQSVMSARDWFKSQKLVNNGSFDNICRVVRQARDKEELDNSAWKLHIDLNSARNLTKISRFGVEEMGWFSLGGSVGNAAQGKFHALTVDSATQILSNKVRFYRSSAAEPLGNIEGDMPPSNWIAPAITYSDNVGAFAWPTAEAVSPGPFLAVTDDKKARPVLTQGLDEASGVFCDLSATEGVSQMPEIPLSEAVNEIWDYFSDYPIRDKNTVASIWLALLHTVSRVGFQRGHVSPAPLVLSDTKNTGKTYLARALGTLTTGAFIGPVQKKEGAGDDDELRKTIDTVLREGGGFLLLDNVLRLESVHLDQVITSPYQQIRPMGQNTRSVTVANRLLITATGNNVELGHDAASRYFPIYLQNPTGRPTTGKYPEPVVAILKNYARLRWLLVKVAYHAIIESQREGVTCAKAGTDRFFITSQILGPAAKWICDNFPQLNAQGADAAIATAELESGADEELSFFGFLQHLRSEYGERKIMRAEISKQLDAARTNYDPQNPHTKQSIFWRYYCEAFDKKVTHTNTASRIGKSLLARKNQNVGGLRFCFTHKGSGNSDTFEIVVVDLKKFEDTRDQLLAYETNSEVISAEEIASILNPHTVDPNFGEFFN